MARRKRNPLKLFGGIVCLVFALPFWMIGFLGLLYRHHFGIGVDGCAVSLLFSVWFIYWGTRLMSEWEFGK